MSHFKTEDALKLLDFKKQLALLACLLSGCASLQPATETKWELLYQEDFESLKLPKTAWAKNELVEKSRYSDTGEYFLEKNPRFKAPLSYRTNTRFGTDDWLQFEGYSRDSKQDIKALFTIEKDPANSANKVIRLFSPLHTNGSLIRSAKPLPPEYRMCIRAGFMAAGTGYLTPNSNGYRGDETAEPWVNAPAVNENGFYWMAILSDEPRPRNNVWIHHHRKVVIDSDNNTYPTGSWSHIWNGKKYVQSGEHPIMMFALDKKNAAYVYDYNRTGQPFISWANGQWNTEAELRQIRAVDAYREGEWYRVCIEKTKQHYKLSMSGNFRYGGKTTYEGQIERSRVFDPEGSPDYFMFGDPHVNFYNGMAYYDDLQLFVPR